MTDKPHRVGQRVSAAIRGSRPASRWIEGCEERVFHQYAGSGHPIEQARFAGVRIADDRHRRHLVAPPLGALDRTRGVQVPQLSAQLGDPTGDPAPVSLQLRLTGTAAADANAAAGAPAGLAGEVATPAPQPLT